ncbi:MAG: hypothetical protein Q4C83_01725 [Candidatus Saccharibacteria bacterium]|nr:hypothetical protein [Candidatus Saccharibacteria bacterium]
MVCIAAFIILAICVLTVPIIRLFNKKLAKNITSLFKKSTHCFTRRVTLRTCDTSFKDDVKNSLLRKVILKHPKWVQPLSILIEVVSVLIIVLTVWSLLVGAKSLVSLYVYGTCNPTTPSACSLDSSESCSIDSVPIEFGEDPLGWIGNWFGEFGNAIKAIPTKMKHWEAKDYLPEAYSYYGGTKDTDKVAVDIFDPGCSVCAKSYRAQKESGFLNEYNVAFIAYPISSSTSAGGYKFANSYLVTQYLMAVQLQKPAEVEEDKSIAWQMIDRMFTGKDADGNDYQNAFNLGYDSKKAEEVLQQWLSDFGYTDDEVADIAKLAKSDKVKDLIAKNVDLVNNKVQTKKIPTMIYNGGRHDGEFKAN